MKGRIVTIGSSAGGRDALTRLVAQLPHDLPAAVFVVNHMPADADAGQLARILDESGPLDCKVAVDGEAFEVGRIYVPPADHHLLLAKKTIMVTKGARENRSRPAIDPLFRSAAVAHGNRVIGVVLTGYLDDGTAGLTAIKRCGGQTVVQEPRDAAYPDMPLNALKQGDVDHTVPLAEMGATLAVLARKRLGKRIPVPDDIRIEARIAERVLSDLASVEALGEQAPFNCPNCGGVLWQMDQGDSDDSLRFRCHTGHSFTAPVLLAEQSGKIEETLWVALRMFEERRNLLMTMSERTMRTKRPGGSGARTDAYASVRERAKESEIHIRRIREMLRTGEPAKGKAPGARALPK
ncbi:MAG TPA: chemotaxis protein CheB [Candidatus Thermoplasmatota archaeon]|nr:chemotaxis protein CheB [Candidatus Thermoplasmatota archaeon]